MAIHFTTSFDIIFLKNCGVGEGLMTAIRLKNYGVGVTN